MNKIDWKKYWTERAANALLTDDQEVVQRTRKGIAVSDDEFQGVLAHVAGLMNLGPEDSLLDLFCGNGAFTIPFAKICKKVVAVDFSDDLIGRIDAQRLGNVETIVSNVTGLSVPCAGFTAVLAYAGLQYLTEAEAAELVAKLAAIVKPGGRIFFGDIPDSMNRWNYVRTQRSKRNYFEHLARGTDTIGTWYSADFFHQLFESYGFSVRSIRQPEDQLNSRYRFDVYAKKEI